MNSDPILNASFAETPGWQILPQWRVGDDRGSLPADKWLELSFWSFKTPANTIDLSSPAIWSVEPASMYGAVLETRCSIRNLDLDQCRPVELVQTLRFHLTSDEQGKVPLSDPEHVKIACVWPKQELAAPVKINRVIDTSGKLQLTVDGVGEAGLERNSSFAEEYEQALPVGLVTMGKPAPVRELSFTIRSTQTCPSIEGIHHSGVWVTAAQKCFVHASMNVAVKAEVKGFGRWRAHQLETVQPRNDSVFELRRFPSA